jgi:hypothetical protein
MAQTLQKQAIVDLLKDENPQDADRFASYCLRLLLEKNKKTGQPQNPWMASKTADALAELFRRVKREGLVFDGVHVTLQSTGVSYDYVAYKNKMLLAYPESKIDAALVYKGDTFTTSKDDGSVSYHHEVANPFAQKAEDVIGGYCVIKNKRGDFLTLLSKEDIDKHRKVAKTDYIWREWFKEMAMKTVVKKACRQHFADIYEGISEMDNAEIDLDNPMDLDLGWKGEIDAIESIDKLVEYAGTHRGRGKSFDQYLAKKMKQLQQ